jgi:PAS domain-containing protein
MRRAGRTDTPLSDIIAHRIDHGIYVGTTVEDVVRRMRERVARGTPSHMTSRMGDGRTITVSIQPRPDGSWVTTHQDVTERERLREQLDMALNTMVQGLGMFDAQQRLIVCNRRYAEMFGLRPEQVTLGVTTLREVLEHRVAAGSYCGSSPEEYIAERLAVARRNAPGIDIQERADGKIIVTSHQPTADGGWVATITDISAQRQLEARLAHLRITMSSRIYLIGRC